MEQEIQLEAWSPEVELLLKSWSEKATCFRWLHDRCEKKYRRRYYSFSIPVIILSTLTGAANVGLSSYVPEDNQSTAQAIVGGINIFAGILSTLQTFLKVCEHMESHRASSVAWSKLGRAICIELALQPSRRSNCHDFLSISRAEYDRLIEQSPCITDDIISVFKSRFKSYKVSKPSITNGLDTCHIYKEKVDDEVIKKELKELSGEEEIEEDISP
tara:strand:+ start:239 stop:886 length:648 start_codon:yes stop_codon:yes gene_type:complete